MKKETWTATIDIRHLYRECESPLSMLFTDDEKSCGISGTVTLTGNKEILNKEFLENFIFAFDRSVGCIEGIVAISQTEYSINVYEMDGRGMFKHVYDVRTHVLDINACGYCDTL